MCVTVSLHFKFDQNKKHLGRREAPGSGWGLVRERWTSRRRSALDVSDIALWSLRLNKKRVRRKIASSPLPLLPKSMIIERSLLLQGPACHDGLYPLATSQRMQLPFLKLILQVSDCILKMTRTVWLQNNKQKSQCNKQVPGYILSLPGKALSSRS